MKKKNLLFLLPVACMLMSCKSIPTDVIPSGNIQDLSDTKVVEKLSNNLNQSAIAASEKFNSFKLTANIHELNLDYLVQAESKGVTQDISLKLSNVTGSAVYQIEDLYSPLKDVKAYMAIKNLGFSLTETMTLSGQSQSYNLGCDPFSAYVYKKDTNVYGDFSDKNIIGFLQTFTAISNLDISTFLRMLVNGMNKIKFNLSNYLDKSVLDNPGMTKSYVETYLKESFASLIQSAKETKFAGVDYVEYNSGYGIKIDAIKILESLGISLKDYGVPENSISAAVGLVFNGDYTPKAINLIANADMQGEYPQGIVSASASVKSNINISLDFTYGESISFPSFDSFQEITV